MVERYLSVGYTRETVEGLPLEFHYQVTPKGWHLKAYYGRAMNPFYNKAGYTEASMLSEMIKLKAAITVKVERKEKQKEARKAFVTSLKEGDVLVCSWGFDQTNVDFYMVQKVCSAKTVELVPVAGKSVRETGWASDMVVATKKVCGEPFKARVSEGNGVKLSSYQWASPYDGRECHRSWYA